MVAVRSINGLWRPDIEDVCVGPAEDPIDSIAIRALHPLLPRSHDWTDHRRAAQQRLRYTYAMDVISYFVHRRGARPCFKKRSSFDGLMKCARHT